MPLGFTVIERDAGVSLGMGLQFREGHVYVQSIEPGSPADTANVAVGDCIEKVNGELLTTPEQAGALLRAAAGSVMLEVVREEKKSKFGFGRRK